ncbi:MAG: methyltransferase [Longimicrobiales bacterium]|nr:methyltransferase [Longimicrobiales bacterium]
MALSLRRIRLRLVWLLVIPFLLLARPTPAALAAGGALAALGLLLRAWAAGHLRKEERLATTGPYAHTRNPLYLGSLLLGTGVTVAGARWVFTLLFLLFFAAVYGRALREEAARMEAIFGATYRVYAARVPLLAWRLRPYRQAGADRTRFSLERYRGNREWEALLGAAAGFAFLAVRMAAG